MDKSVNIRTMVLTGLLAIASRRLYGGAMPDEVAGFLGMILGGVYDFVAYTIKSKFKD